MINDITVFNIRRFLSSDDRILAEEDLYQILSDFSCGRNLDVEKFIKEQSIDFTKKNQSVTYLVFDNIYAELVGYYTIAIKPINVSASKFSKTMNRKIARVGELDEESGTYTLSAYLIAQLGKNFANGANYKISGQQLLQAAIDTILRLQYMAGGMVVFLETENDKKLLDFYENQNGFKRFDTKDIRIETENPHTLTQLLKIL